MLHRQMDQYRDQPQHLEKIAYQQRLLQEDLVHIRAELSRESTVRRDTSPSGWAGQGAAFLIPPVITELVARGKSLGVSGLLAVASLIQGVTCSGVP